MTPSGNKLLNKITTSGADSYCIALGNESIATGARPPGLPPNARASGYSYAIVVMKDGKPIYRELGLDGVTREYDIPILK